MSHFGIMPNIHAARRLWNHLTPLLLYGGLTVVYTWPAAAQLDTHLTGAGEDARHMLWRLWQTWQALQGQQPLFDAPLIYYPQGQSLLVNALGPTAGVFALPFWTFGPVAAYNLALLLMFALTGYSLYLLARELNFSRGSALFAGLILLTAEMHVAGPQGHVEKTFLGFTPIALLGLHRLFDLNRRQAWAWALLTAIVLLATLLFNAWHFILAMLAAACLGLAWWLAAPRPDRPTLLKRAALLAIATLLLCGPVVAAMSIESSRLPTGIDRNIESLRLQPDLAEFFLPSRTSRLFGQPTADFMLAHGINWTIESTVSLVYVGLLLCGLALFRQRAARPWLILLAICLVFALGPSLQVLGQRQFTEYDLPVMLPYAALTALPGTDFMRASGRFMMVGYVGFGLAAGYGLSWLAQRAGRFAPLVVGLACAGILIETWPAPVPTQVLPPVPDFYRQVANEPASYGILDLPIRTAPDHDWAVDSVNAQIDQLTHRKGIMAGYVSFAPRPHPIVPCLYSDEPQPIDVSLNGRPVDCFDTVLYSLAYNNYRYLVVHAAPPDSWAANSAATLVQRILGDQVPLLRDNLITVYALPRSVPPADNVWLGRNWLDRETEWRWATSPATLEVIATHAQTATLQLAFANVYDPVVQTGRSTQSPHGTLTVQTADAAPLALSVTADTTVTVPVQLIAGRQAITLTWQAGSFRPSDFGAADHRYLSFAVRSIDLRLDQEHPTP